MKTAKNGLTNGCLVQFRNKSVMMYVSTKKDAGFIDPRDSGHMDLDSYDENLKLKEVDAYITGDDSDWDIIAYTKPLDLVGMKMNWEDKFTVNPKYLAWTEPSGIDFDKPAILRQEWTNSRGTYYRIVETNGCHAGIMFEGFTMFDSGDLDLEPMQFSDNFSKPSSNDPEDYKLKLVKYLN